MFNSPVIQQILQELNKRRFAGDLVMEKHPAYHQSVRFRHTKTDSYLGMPMCPIAACGMARDNLDASRMADYSVDLSAVVFTADHMTNTPAFNPFLYHALKMVQLQRM
jgi:hypothetical protein